MKQPYRRVWLYINNNKIMISYHCRKWFPSQCGRPGIGHRWRPRWSWNPWTPALCPASSRSGSSSPRTWRTGRPRDWEWGSCWCLENNKDIVRLQDILTVKKRTNTLPAGRVVLPFTPVLLEWWEILHLWHWSCGFCFFFKHFFTHKKHHKMAQQWVQLECI